MMKKLLVYTFICLSALNFSACSNDDDSDSSDKLVGTWNVVEIGFSTQNANGEVIFEESYDTTLCDPDPTMIFNASGDASMTNYSIDVDVDNNVTCTIEDEILEGNWVLISDNNYNITLEGETIEFDASFTNSNNTVTLTSNIVYEDNTTEDQYIVLNRQ